MNKVHKQLMKKMMTKKQYRQEMRKGRSTVGLAGKLGSRIIATNRMYSRAAAKKEERKMYDRILEGT